ncbi:MAG: dephospho-CoA kinase [Alphaproteobacteria bacterium]
MKRSWEESDFKVIGVTGGMASGKSHISKHFYRNYNYGLFNADKLVHILMATDPETIAAIEFAFPGSTVNRRTDRDILSDIVTKDPSALQTLEKILHPYIKYMAEYSIEQAYSSGKKGIVLDIPLLYESGADKYCKAVIVAHTVHEKERAMKRPGMTEEKWQVLTARQDTLEQRLEHSHKHPKHPVFLVDTDGSKETVKERSTTSWRNG